MSPQPRIVHEQPNVENTIALSAYRSQYPARFSLLDDDKYVLHGGGSNYTIHIADNSDTQRLEIDPQLGNFSGSSVSVYVLNQCLVLWMNGTNVGIEIPYPLLALHALKQVHGSTVLHLQLLSNDVFRCVSLAPTEYTQTLDLILHEDTTLPLASHNPLFAHNSNIQQLYDELSTCSALHFDSESESESDPFAPDHQWITADNGEQTQLEMPSGWLNVGDADDLEFEEAPEEPESDGEAGMNVTVVSGQLAGVRRRNSQADDSQKIKRLQS